MSDGLISADMMKAAVPLGREGSVDDMAGLILYLASEVSATFGISSLSQVPYNLPSGWSVHQWLGAAHRWGETDVVPVDVLKKGELV